MATSAIDAALIAKLVGDATLTTLLPDGVYFDEGRPGATRFVVVSLVEASDESVFGGRAIEDRVYSVKAVVLGTTGANARQAADRIDAVLEDSSLTISGYTHMATFREEPFEVVEVDESDPTIRWLHAGGRYRVQASL